MSWGTVGDLGAQLVVAELERPYDEDAAAAGCTLHSGHAGYPAADQGGVVGWGAGAVHHQDGVAFPGTDQVVSDDRGMAGSPTLPGQGGSQNELLQSSYVSQRIQGSFV